MTKRQESRRSETERRALRETFLIAGAITVTAIGTAAVLLFARDNPQPATPTVPRVEQARFQHDFDQYVGLVLPLGGSTLPFEGPLFTPTQGNLQEGDTAPLDRAFELELAPGKCVTVYLPEHPEGDLQVTGMVNNDEEPVIAWLSEERLRGCNTGNVAPSVAAAFEIEVVPVVEEMPVATEATLAAVT